MTEEAIYQTILVGVDGSEQANFAFKRAVALAKKEQSRVIVAHVIEQQLYPILGMSELDSHAIKKEEEQSKNLLAEYTAYAEQVGFSQLEVVTAFGSPKKMMCEELPQKFQADLIMVGQSGLNAVERVMVGSVSSYIIRHAPCDVWIVHEQKE